MQLCCIISCCQFKTKNRKFTLKEILSACFIFLKISSSLKLFHYKNIHPSTVRKNYDKLNKYNIFRSTYLELLKKYIIKTKGKKLKYIYSDTSTFYNKYNIDLAKINSYNKNKRVIKLSIITDSKGISLCQNLYSGNMNNYKILKEQLVSFNNEYSHINFNKSTFMADSIYDGKELRELLKKTFGNLIIPYNKRGTKNPKKIKKLNAKEKKTYNFSRRSLLK